MRHTRRVASVAAVLIGLLAFVSPAPAQRDRTLRVDAVELAGGTQTPGREEHSVTRGRYTYWFTSEENKAEFEKDPARFEIQLGGACARMGPLSGEGSTSIYAAYDGKVYIFASESCRATFLKSPEELLEHDDPMPGVTPEGAAKGAVLLERVISHHGGPAIDAARSYAERFERNVDVRGEPMLNVRGMIIEFPGRAKSEEAWGRDSWGHVISEGDAFFYGAGSSPREMAPSQRRAFEREVARNLLFVLKSAAEPGAVVAHAGRGKVGQTDVELLLIARRGVAITLSIDPATGRILAQSHRGRGPGLMLGAVERRFSEFKESAGVLLPMRTDFIFDGRPVESMSRTLTSLEVNAPVDPMTFARPNL